MLTKLAEMLSFRLLQQGIFHAKNGEDYNTMHNFYAYN